MIKKLKNRMRRKLKRWRASRRAPELPTAQLLLCDNAGKVLARLFPGETVTYAEGTGTCTASWLQIRGIKGFVRIHNFYLTSQTIITGDRIVLSAPINFTDPTKNTPPQEGDF